MLVTSSEKSGSLVVIISGSLGLKDTPSIQLLAKEWYASTYSKVVLDITRISEFDSSVAGEFVAIELNLKKVEKKLVLIAHPTQIRILTDLGIDGMFTIYTSIDEFF